MKRFMVWVDSPDENAEKVRVKLKKYLTKAGLWHMMADTVEVIEKDD